MDYDENGILDSCEFDPTSEVMDCNQNGIFDPCELKTKTAIDCNENGILDSCDATTDPSLDCDGNGSLDSCQLKQGLRLQWESDCRCVADGTGHPRIAMEAGIPDSCDLLEEGADCNRNQLLDSCEIQDGTERIVMGMEPRMHVSPQKISQTAMKTPPQTSARFRALRVGL